MKRNLRKRVGRWELSIPLRAPVRGIWLYASFEEAWGNLWRAGYPPGLPSEIKLAVRNAEPSRLGIDYLADVDDAVHDAFDATSDLLSARLPVPQPIAAEPSDVKHDSPEPLPFPRTSLTVPAGSNPLILDSEVSISDSEAVKESLSDGMREGVRAAALSWNEPKAVPGRSPWIARGAAVGWISGLAVLLLLVLFWPKHALPTVTNSAIPNAAIATPEASVSPKVAVLDKSHASIAANDRSWITACADGQLIFSKLFTAGSKDSIDFIKRAVVRMGDAGPVEITVDGKSVGPLGRKGQVRVIELVPGVWHFEVGGDPDDCTLTR